MSLLDDANTESGIVTISLPGKGNDSDELCAALTKIIHEETTAYDEGNHKRTGKPEHPRKTIYTIPGLTPAIQSTALRHSSIDGHVFTLHHSDFWQLYPLLATSIVPLRTVFSNNISHPLRAKLTPGTILYERHVHSLDTTFSLRVLDKSSRRDIEAFHNWHNSERVNAFWGNKGTVDDHIQYLTDLENDNHIMPVIGSFDGEPFAYFELYWAKEDVIGSHANATDWDAGWHALVGNEAHRGPHKVKTWISCVTHYLFLRDPRTQRVMLEPRVDNKVFLSYLTKHGYSIEKEFNFPHKRAALVTISREKFFEVQGVVT